MAEIKNENHIVIHGWMRNELGLKGNELVVYALIYGFSQDGESSFHGKLQFVQDWTGVSKKTAITILQNLEERGLVSKQRSSYGKFEYGVKTTLSQGEEITPSWCKNYTTEVKKLHHDGVKITPPSNKDIDNDIDNCGSISASAPIREEKHKYGQYKNVLLTEKEYNKLLSDFKNGMEAIEYLSEHRATKGYKAKSDYLAIRKWVFLALEEKEIRERENEQRKARLQANEVKAAGKETQRSADPFAELKRKLKDEPESDSKWRTNGL